MFGVVQDANAVKGANYLRITYHTSTDGITWGTTQYLGTVAEFTAAYPGFEPNHITAFANPVISGQIDLLVNAIVTPRPANWLVGQVLVHAAVNLSDPTAISYPLAPTAVLAPVAGSWDDIGIYRSGFILTAASGTMTMRLWYSGIATAGYPESCRTGYTEGVIYQYDAGGIVAPVPTDNTAPTVTFSMPATSNSLTVALTVSATDNVAADGFLLTENNVAPLADFSNVTTDGAGGTAKSAMLAWSATPPTEYVFTAEGSKTLYAWAKDAAGNVSDPVSDSVTITISALKDSQGSAAAFKSAGGAAVTFYDASGNQI